MWAPQHSAFSAYTQRPSNAVADSLVSCETLHKKCFSFLRKMDEDRKLRMGASGSRLTVPSPGQDSNAKHRNQPKSGFHHVIAERNRRDKLKQHFKNLSSLLPRSCKKDKLSILENTTSYLRELKLRVCELERQNESANEQSFNSDSSLLYRSDDVVLERCKDILCQVKIIINVQRNTVSCPATLLMKVIEMLSAEQLEIISLSHEKGFGFQAIFVVLPKGKDWDVSQWGTFGSLVAQTLN